jgi:hypothetical protein
MALNFQPVSTCSSGKGSGPGVQHHGAVLADRIEHDRPLRLGDRLAQDVDALGLEPVEIGKAAHWLRG